jgi:hypothetical protein
MGAYRYYLLMGTCRNNSIVRTHLKKLLESVTHRHFTHSNNSIMRTYNSIMRTYNSIMRTYSSIMRTSSLQMRTVSPFPSLSVMSAPFFTRNTTHAGWLCCVAMTTGVHPFPSFITDIVYDWDWQWHCDWAGICNKCVLLSPKTKCTIVIEIDIGRVLWLCVRYDSDNG